MVSQCQPSTFINITHALKRLKIKYLKIVQLFVQIDGVSPFHQKLFAGQAIFRQFAPHLHVSFDFQTRPDFGQEAADRDTYTVYVPFATDVQRDDRKTVTACALDADLVSDELVVRAVDQDSWNVRKAAVATLET